MSAKFPNTIANVAIVLAWFALGEALIVLMLWGVTGMLATIVLFVSIALIFIFSFIALIAKGLARWREHSHGH